jgi:hypothetical protein
LALGVERRAIHSVAVAKATPLSAEEREALARAARDLPGLWHAETTTARDRKELLRTLVAEAIVTVHQQPRRAEIEIAWEGGARSQLSVPLIRRGSVNEGRAGPTDDVLARVQEIELAQVLDPRLLNRALERSWTPRASCGRGSAALMRGSAPCLSLDATSV